ncbi:MAG: threonine--tRNA ligase [Candidatus Brocadiales bacterium]
MVTVKLPDGTEKKYSDNITVAEIASDIGRGTGGKIIAGKTNGTVVDLSSPVTEDTTISVITEDSEEGLEILRHSTAHIMAQAVTHLYPNVKLGIGPCIENGFYYDFDLDQTLSQEDLKKVESEMKRIISGKESFVRAEIPKEKALKKMEELGQPYKVELIKNIDDDKVSFYTQGDFIDLCRGPHIQSTGKVKAFKLLSVAGAYWRGKETNPMLQRIYGTAFARKEDLGNYLKLLEEVKKRDHRKLGKELDLFSFKDECGAGLVLWHPKAGRIRTIIEDFWRKEHYKRDYEIVYTPHIAKLDLWKTSGHWNFYRESMFSPLDVDGQEYLLRPMNCPFAILMYKSHLRSYRDLPLRWAELGTVYRYERTGVLHGLLRVRGFTQDDAHIFCTPDQFESEVINVIDLAQFMLSSFGFNDYEIELSVRGKGEKGKYIGDDATWELAESALQNALEKKRLSYTLGEGEAKFYGPAIDIKVKDALGRGWQGPTIQVDFNLPERFDANFIGDDGKQHRVVMIHRTVLGAMERFLGCLIEHYAGNFPLWLAPLQVRITPVSDAHNEYALSLKKKLVDEGFRVDCNTRNAKIGYKIRESILEKIPYILIVGDKEVNEETISVRSRKKGDEGSCSLEQFLERIKQELVTKE